MRLALQRPRLKRSTVVYSPEGEQGVVLLSEGRRQFQSEPIFSALIPLLDGTHSVQDIARKLATRHTLKDILGAIHLLQKWDHLVDADIFLPDQPVYWEAQGVPWTALNEAVVAVHCVGQVTGEPFRAALDQLGITVVDDRTALDIVLTDDYLRPELGVHNKHAKRPWLLVRPDGIRVWLGPLIVPRETACWECLAHRLRLNLGIEQFVKHQTGRSPLHPLVTIPATTDIVANMVAVQVAKWFVERHRSQLVNTLFTWQIANMVLEPHPITRRPQCPTCGSPAPVEPFPIRLRQSEMNSTEGGFRSTSPEDTLAQFRHHLDPLTGLVSQLEPVSDADGIHVYRARSIRIATSDSWQNIQAAERFYAGGKGRTAIQAKASAFCKALERYSSQRLGDEPSVLARYAELGESAIHPYAVVHFSSQQFAERDVYNQRARVGFVPLPFDDNALISWVKVWSLTDETWRYLPRSFCYFNVRESDRDPYIRGDSNGNAAGSSLEDAILQGFFELVERDCAAMWWYNRIQRPGVAIQGIDDELMGSLARYYGTLGRRFWLLDLTNDWDIPTFVALSSSVDGTSGGTSYGFGTHLDPRIAAIRALTEMNQLLPSVLRQAEREDRRFPDALTGSYTLGSVSPVDEPCLLPHPNLPLRHIDHYPRPAFSNIGEALQVCLNRVQQLNMEMLVHDLTRPDVGLPVVKVIVPGMRHFWRRLAPGRLYDVPVKLGWLPAPLPEDQLNPLDITL